MKKGFSLVMGALALSIVIFYLAACQKANNTRPQILLYKSALYLATDTTLKAGTTFNVYVTASKAGVDQILKYGLITRTVNDTIDTLQVMNLSTQYLSQPYSYMVKDSGTVERYTFSVTQTNDLRADTSINITVN